MNRCETHQPHGKHADDQKTASWLAEQHAANFMHVYFSFSLLKIFSYMISHAQ